MKPIKESELEETTSLILQLKLIEKNLAVVSDKLGLTGTNEMLRITVKHMTNLYNELIEECNASEKDGKTQ